MANPLVIAAEEAAEVSLRLALSSLNDQQKRLSERHDSAKGTAKANLETKTANTQVVAQLTTAKSRLTFTRGQPDYVSKYDATTREHVDASASFVDTALALLMSEQTALDANQASASAAADAAKTAKEDNQELIDALTLAWKALKRAEKASEP